MAMNYRSTVSLDGDAVIPLELVKTHLRVDCEDDDDLIGAFRGAALEWIEGYTAKSLKRRDWTASFDGFGDRLRLPVGPVALVTAVSYLDQAGAAVSLDTDDWRLAGETLVAASGQSWPITAPGGGTVTIAFEAGYSDLTTEARALRTAALLLIGHFYRNREQVITGTIATTVPFGVTELCASYRTPVVG